MPNAALIPIEAATLRMEALDGAHKERERGGDETPLPGSPNCENDLPRLLTYKREGSLFYLYTMVSVRNGRSDMG